MAHGHKTGGRKLGVPNKNTQQIRDMIVGALVRVGGQEYLERQALDNPNAFLGLIGKVMPMQLTGDPDKPVAISFSWAPATPQAVADATTEAVGQVLEVAWTENSEDT